MVKKRALLLIFVLFISIFIANAKSDFQRGDLEEGESKIIKMDDGFYVLTLVAVSDKSDTVIFRLNNEMSGKLREKENYVFNDASEIVVREVIANEPGDGNDFAGYYIYVSDNSPMNVKLHSLNSSVCDFDKKCENETQEYCCYDCGCSGGSNCMNNECFDDEEEECEKDSDCYIYDACITDSCVGGECKHEREDGCELGKKCVEEGYVNNERYCGDNEWVTQKKDEGCDNDYECMSGRCKSGECIKKRGSKGIIVFVLILLLLIIVAYTRKDYIIKKLRRRVI